LHVETKSKYINTESLAQDNGHAVESFGLISWQYCLCHTARDTNLW